MEAQFLVVLSYIAFVSYCNSVLFDGYRVWEKEPKVRASAIIVAYVALTPFIENALNGDPIFVRFVLISPAIVFGLVVGFLLLYKRFSYCALSFLAQVILGGMGDLRDRKVGFCVYVYRGVHSFGTMLLVLRKSY